VLPGAPNHPRERDTDILCRSPWPRELLLDSGGLRYYASGLAFGEERMKTLLISLNEYSAQSFGVLSVADAIAAGGCEVKILGTPDGLFSVFTESACREAFLQYVNDFQPDLVGLSALTAGAVRIGMVVTALKERFPTIPVVLGGYHTMVYREQILTEYPELDFVFYGEAEGTIPQFLAELQEGASGIAGVKGLIFRQGGGIHVNPPPPPACLNGINTYRAYREHTAWDFLDRWRAQRGDVAHPSVDFPHGIYVPLASPQVFLMLSRGCPYKCTFCHLVQSPYSGVRYTSPEAFAGFLQDIISHYHETFTLNLRDSAFNLNDEWAESIIDIIERTPNIVEWYCQLRPDLVKAGFVRRLRGARCRAVGLHVEAGTDVIRNDVLGKQVTTAQLESAFRIVKEEGVFARGTIIIGTPEETEEDLEQGLRLMAGLGVDHTAPCPLTLIPGTPLWDRYPNLRNGPAYNASLDHKYLYRDPESRFEAARALYVGRMDYDRFQKWYWIYAAYFSFFGQMLRRMIAPDSRPLLVVQGSAYETSGWVSLFSKVLLALVNHVNSHAETAFDVLTLQGLPLPLDVLPKRIRTYETRILPLDLPPADAFWVELGGLPYDALVAVAHFPAPGLLDRTAKIGCRLGASKAYLVDTASWTLREYDLVNKLLSTHRFAPDGMREQF
jgi:radical SAM superfamily enzyme YgiQ (UPF0313 family)